MAAIIQFRRDTAANWTSNSPTLADGEFALESDTTKYKIGDGSTTWTSLAYGGLGSIDTALIDAKGDLVGGTADNTVAKLTVGSNGQVLVADSSATTGLKWVTNESIVNWHEAVKLGTAAVLPNSPTYSNETAGVGATLTAGSQARLVVDGANATTGDRVLVQDQASALQNGIYDVTAQGASGSAAWILTRAVDFDGAPTGQIKQGESAYVLAGSNNVGQGFVVTTTSDPHVVGTNDITFTQFTGTQAFTAGTYLTISGNTINHDNSGASAGSYGSATQVATLTTDAQGHLTAVSNTTIAIPSTAVTDFTEAVQDVAGAQVATNGSHTGIAATYDDAGDGAVDLTLTVSGVSAAAYGSATQVPGYTVDTYGRLTTAANTTIAIPSTAVTDFTEAVQDVSGAQLATDGTHTGITATYDDAGDGAIDLALVTENVQDITGAQIATNGTHVGLTAAYDDAGDGAVDLTVAATLGTHTSGNYIATVAGTANEIEVSGSGSETAAVTVGLPNDVTIGNDLAVTEDITAKTLALSSSATALLNITSTDTTVTNYGPTIELCRDGTHENDSPIGRILFTGDDEDSTKQTYGQISVNIEEKGADAFGDMEFWLGYAGSARIQRNMVIDDYYTSFSHDIRIGNGSDFTQGYGALSNERHYTGYWVELGHDGNNDLTADRIVFFPNASGTLITTGNAELLFDGTTAATQAANDNTAKVATTAFVMTEIGDYLTTSTAASTYAPIASPTLTGTPAAPTAAADTNTTQIATTAYVQTELGALSSDSITDADANTKIQVEESADENIIRFDTAGTERMSIAADGTVTIVGDLVVNGTETTISSTTITVDDKNIEIGSVATPSDTTADGGGLTLKGATDKTWNWVNSTDAWTSSEHVALATGKSVYIDGVLQLSKNALAATVVLADGVIATTQAANDSSTKVATTAFVMTEVGDYLTTSTASSTYAPLASPTLTGVPAGPTAAADTNTTQLATTAFVMTEIGDYLTTSTATSTYAPIASPTLTGVPAAPTAAADTNTTQIATTAYVQTELSALSSDSISDADSDTKIQVEESADEDKIRFDVAGSEFAVMDGSTVDVTGNIIYNLARETQTGTTYTFVAGDRGKYVTMNNGSAQTVTVPPNSGVALAVGTQIQVIGLGAGEITMVAGSGVTLRYTPGLKLRAQYSSCTCIKIATDEWILVGDLEA